MTGLPRSASAGAGPVGTTPTPPAGGQPLSRELREEFEPRFGQDLGQVRLHAGGAAARSAESVRAKAYTMGPDIVFGAGQYAPERADGRWLLAHELTHVVQQAGGTGDGQSARGWGVSALPGTPTLQRFTEEEHERLGDVAAVGRIDLGNGVVLSWGQLVALAGDHYANAEDLLKDTETRDGQTRIRARMKNSGISTPVASFGAMPTAADLEAATINELLLGLVNTPHFVAGGSAHESWLSYHERALTEAMLAGLARSSKQLDKAYFLEAFGQHFLTDAFSSGHLRTPRQQIIDYYVDTFAPAVVGNLISNLRERVVDELYDQIVGNWGYALWIPSLWPLRASIFREIREKVQAKIDSGLAALGGKDVLAKWIGQFLGGVVSRAIHDLDNRNGVWVTSQMHPEPWLAFGDHALDATDPTTGDPVNREEAEKAVLAGKADIDTAYDIAEKEAKERDAAPPLSALPESVYFDLNGDWLRFDVMAVLSGTAAYMKYNPDKTLHLEGHTDPIGTDGDNLDLGERRAAAVAKFLEEEGVSSSRITSESFGETRLVTTDPRKYPLDRRVRFIWGTGALGVSRDVAADRAREAIRTRIPAPYAAEAYLPDPVDSLNQRVPNYQWGSLSTEVRQEMGNWLGEKLKKYGADLIARKELDDMTVDGRTIQVRPFAQAVLKEATSNPISFLEGTFDKKAGI